MNEKKPILFGPLPPPFGGVSIFMKALAARAAECGFRVWSYKGKPENNGIYVNHRRFGHLFALLREGRGARITDSTHFHVEYPNAVLLPLWLFTKFFLRFRWIKILHDGSLPTRYENFNFLQRWFINSAIRRVDEFIIYSDDLEIWLREEFTVRQKISSIPPLLPLPPNWKNEKLRDELSEKLGRFSAHQKRVCAVGIFIPSYGFHHLAEAIEKLRCETNDDIGLFLVDGGFEGTDNFREMVLKNRDWIETAEPHPNLPDIFRQSDVFVRSFAHESYGLSRIEAIWCGTPVIATNVGETRGMAVYQFGDEAALISHLRKILNGENICDTQKWAEIFDREAAQNLERYLRVITGGEQL